MTERPQVNIGELRKGGLVKIKGKDMFSMWMKTTCSNLTSTQLRKLADITDKYARGYLLFATRQIPIIPFVELKNVDGVKEELADVYLELDRCGPTVRNINVCYDDKICPDALTNSISLAEKLDSFFRIPSRHKVKIGVAGCGKDCVVSRVLSDLGFVAVERNGRVGYDAYVGGRLGVKPFVGIRMAECLSEDACERFVRNAFELLWNEGKTEERIADLIDRLGAEEVKRRLTTDLRSGLPLTPVTCKTALKERDTDKIIVRMRATCGEVTSKQLRRIATIAEKYGKGFVHFVMRGSPEIPCIDRRYLKDIAKELQEAGMQVLGDGLDNLQCCFGNYCIESNVDPQSLLRRIEVQARELDLGELGVKISAAGCPNSCGIAQLNDIGFYGVVEPEVNAADCNGCDLCVTVCKRHAITANDGLAVIDIEECRYCGQCIAVCPSDAIKEKRKGFAVFVGGSVGEDTRLGEVVAEFLSEDEALRITERCLGILKEKQANAATVIDEVGLDQFKQMLLSGSKKSVLRRLRK